VDGTLALGLIAAALVFVMASTVLRTRPIRSHRRRRWDRFEPEQKLAVGAVAATVLIALVSRCG
jgi:hypothetical protein